MCPVEILAIFFNKNLCNEAVKQLILVVCKVIEKLILSHVECFNRETVGVYVVITGALNKPGIVKGIPGYMNFPLWFWATVYGHFEGRVIREFVKEFAVDADGKAGWFY